jgi:SGNH domain (fused to AT3 domains)
MGVGVAARGARSRSWAARSWAARSWAARSSIGILVVVVAVVAVVGRHFPVTASSPTRTRAVSRRMVDDALDLRPDLRPDFRPRMVLLKMILEPTDSAPRSAPSPVALYRHFSGRRPLRIMVVGDSVGVSFAVGLQQWADQHGNAQVLDAAHMWCPLGRWLPMSHGIGIQLPGDGCTDWGLRWADDIASFDPDVVIVNFTIWEMAPRLLPGRTDLEQPGSPKLDAWQLSEYRAAADVLNARGAPVVWFTAPCEEAPIERGSPMWVVNRRTIPKLAASLPFVHVVDLDHELCAHGANDYYAGVDARPDGAHFSPAGALAVSNWVMPIVLGKTPNPATVAETDPPSVSAATTRRAS